MDPIPATIVAIEHLDRLGQTRVEEALRRIADEVESIVPVCVGLSLSLVEDGVTLTSVAAGLDTLSLDVPQDRDGGPSVEMAAEDADTNPLDEERWSVFARASAARGVQSSLSMPLLNNDVVVGEVTLYASAPGAFLGNEDAIAQVVGASAAASVRDADLTFSTRLLAAEAPELLANQTDIDLAVRFISCSQTVDTDTATQRLREAAARAGVSEVEIAHTVIRTHLPQVE